MYVEATTAVNIRGNIISGSTVTREARDTEYYISLFPFDKEILRYFEQTKSVAQFKGKQYCNYIAFDIDNDGDLERSQGDTLSLINHWQENYQLSPDDVYIYFSGSKGFHLILYRSIFGEIEPMAGIHNYIKKAAIDLSGGITIDTNIYDATRLFRVENSVNKKTGLYKIRLTYDELFALKIDEIKELAKGPRDLPGKKLRINEHIQRIVHSAFITDEQEREISTGFFLPATSTGERNNKMYKQACVLFQTSELHEKSIKEIITSINLASPAPLNDDEVDSLIRSARTRRKGKEVDDPIKISLFNDLWDGWIDSIRKETNKIDLVFDSLNDEFNGKLRSLLGIILGYGGSKKSLYGQNVCYTNVMKGLRTVYSNMEMGNAPLTARFIDIATSGYDNYMGTYYAEQAYHTGDDLEKLRNTMKSIMSDKLIVCENSNMTSAKYDRMIDKITNDYGPIDVLIVDGMSMMGGTGTEVEKASMHSKELKELAKKWNILVLPIVHASKGEDLTTRDLTKKARASEKIIDNADWIMTLSLLKDINDKYIETEGVYHCWNKRGSGKRIEKAWEFKHCMLTMKENDKEINTIRLDDLQ